MRKVIESIMLGGQPVKLEQMIDILENILGCKANKRYLPMQPGDAMVTYADITNLKSSIGYVPKEQIEKELSRFVEWIFN